MLSRKIDLNFGIEEIGCYTDVDNWPNVLDGLLQYLTDVVPILFWSPIFSAFTCSLFYYSSFVHFFVLA